MACTHNSAMLSTLSTPEGIAPWASALLADAGSRKRDAWWSRGGWEGSEVPSPETFGLKAGSAKTR